MKVQLCAAGSASSQLEVKARAGDSLSHAIWLSGLLPPQPLCSGLGSCGRCRVRWIENAPAPFLVEETLLDPAAVAEGWRLACRHAVPQEGNTLKLELPPEAFAALPTVPEIDTSSTAEELSLAVDLGTTSVYWQAVRANGQVVAQGSFLNPQAGAGADVISRLAVARDVQGRTLLAGLVHSALYRLCGQLQQVGNIRSICLAGNPAMTAIALEQDVRGLCVAPYRLDFTGNAVVFLPDLPPVYVPPLPAPFVGGDVSAGLTALLAADTPRPFILADLGTNGELALVDAGGELFLTSVPLGPALEGIGPQCGQLAGPDVLTHFSLTPFGLIGHSWDGGDGIARGISATGYLSLLAILRQIGLLDERGLFTESPPANAMPLTRKLAQGLYRHRGQICLCLPRGQWLAASDVEELLKIRAAFGVALEILLAEAGLAPGDVACFCLAGALGEHIRPDVLEQLGFVPEGLARRIRAVGNTSLAGAALLVLHEQERERLAALCTRSRLLPLVDSPDFHSNYLRHMRFGA